jgi:hypothetical protein
MAHRDGVAFAIAIAQANVAALECHEYFSSQTAGQPEILKILEQTRPRRLAHEGTPKVIVKHIVSKRRTEPEYCAPQETAPGRGFVSGIQNTVRGILQPGAV